MTTIKKDTSANTNRSLAEITTETSSSHICNNIKEICRMRIGEVYKGVIITTGPKTSSLKINATELPFPNTRIMKAREIKVLGVLQ